MDDPNLVGELYRIDHAKRIAAEPNAISNTPEPRPRRGFAISDLPPSAANVKAARQIVLASSGNFSNSFNAALIHETGRVFRVICQSVPLPN
jgi:hypothetical protein